MFLIDFLNRIYKAILPEGILKCILNVSIQLLNRWSTKISKKKEQLNFNNYRESF